MISSVYLYAQIQENEKLNKQLDYLSSLNNKKIEVDFNGFIATKPRLTKRGIKYEEVHNLNISPSFDIYSSASHIYVIDK